MLQAATELEIVDRFDSDRTVSPSKPYFDAGQDDSVTHPQFGYVIKNLERTKLDDEGSTVLSTMNWL